MPTEPRSRWRTRACMAFVSFSGTTRSAGTPCSHRRAARCADAPSQQTANVRKRALFPALVSPCTSCALKLDMLIVFTVWPSAVLSVA
jgi:hypothetical protein